MTWELDHFRLVLPFPVNLGNGGLSVCALLQEALVSQPSMVEKIWGDLPTGFPTGPWGRMSYRHMITVIVKGVAEAASCIPNSMLPFL